MALQFQNRIRMELSSIPGRGTGGNSCVRRFRLIPEEGIAGGAGRRAGLDSRLNIHQFTHRQDFRQAADAIPGPIRSQILPWPRWAEFVAQNFPDPPYKPKPTPTMNERLQMLLSLPRSEYLSARAAGLGEPSPPTRASVVQGRFVSPKPSWRHRMNH